ncbi:hypothetical protein [Paraglaciecola marina]|uniref:hypothetical protein n=1 Tax=Paraglaciecola marina TaxID=2500157 RepID=UPI00105E5ED3|nr:hypothetical protein [Paraglaciecola marina]
MKKIILVVSILLFTQVSFANTASGNEALYKIVKDFESAITTKDRSKYFHLFYEGTVSWVGVFSSDDYNKEKSKADTARANGEPATKPMKTFPGDHVHFFDVMIAPDKNFNKIAFENVKIQHDGEIANVYFDYAVYHGDGVVKTFWGKKSMLLVNTESGWKINSAIHSVYTPEDKR